MGVAGHRARPEQQVWDSVPHGKPHRLKPPSLQTSGLAAVSLHPSPGSGDFCDPERRARPWTQCVDTFLALLSPPWFPLGISVLF